MYPTLCGNPQMGPWTDHCVALIQIKSGRDTKMEKCGTLSLRSDQDECDNAVHNQVNTVTVDKQRSSEATNAR